MQNLCVFSRQTLVRATKPNDQRTHVMAALCDLMLLSFSGTRCRTTVSQQNRLNRVELLPPAVAADTVYL